MYSQKSSSMKIELSRGGNTSKPEPMATELYKQQQAQIESQQLNHMMAASCMGLPQQHQSPTHFFASLLQNPAVLGNPELMASVAGMLQQSLANPSGNIAMAAQVSPQYPNGGNCFRNFSIPNSESSSQLRSIIESSVCGSSSSEHNSQRSGASRSTSLRTSSISSSDKGSSADADRSNFSHTSSDHDSHTEVHHVDIKNFRDSNDLVVNKVMMVIEEILANDNIKKNNFLAKLFEDISSDRNGRPEILVKRVAGFKRVKAITTEFKIVQEAMKQSSMFDISKDELAAFRTTPLPNMTARAETTGSVAGIQQKSASRPSASEGKDQKVVKKILAINFNEEEFSIEKMTQIFEKIGEIAQIVLVRPNKKIPEFLSDYAQWVPDLGKRPCAIIDFESQESAQNACREINMTNKEGSLIRCALLKPGARIKRTLYRKYNSSSSEEGTTSSESSSRKTSLASSRENSQDSGLHHNNDIFAKKQTNFNRKDVKNAISKHFISLGAWKNAATMASAGNGPAEAAILTPFVRQPKGPVSDQGSGFSGDYQRSRMC